MPSNIEIKTVEITRSDRPPDPGAKEALERLIATWLVRAYLRKYGRPSDEPFEDAESEE